MRNALRGLRCVTAAATLLVLTALCWQCIDIYLVGNSPANLDAQGVHLTPVYSAEIVGARLRALYPLLAGYVLLVIGALTVQACAAPASQRMTITQENQLRLMKRRVAGLPAEARTEERRRRMIRIVSGMAVLACAAGALAYLLDGQHFTSWDLENVMGRMLLHIAPWVTAAFAVLIAASYACARSVGREIVILKGAPKSAPTEKNVRAFPMGAVRLGIFAVAVVFIVLGVMNGGLYDVLVKAINICTECIGLG